MLYREAMALVKHEITKAGMNPSQVDTALLRKAARAVITYTKTGTIYLSTTPSGRHRYYLHSVLPGETWRYIDVNARSIASAAHRYGLRCRMVSPTEIYVTKD